MSKIKRIIGLIAVLLVVALSIFANGCHTIHGAGEDIERGGEEIQKAAE